MAGRGNDVVAAGYHPVGEGQARIGGNNGVAVRSPGNEVRDHVIQFVIQRLAAAERRIDEGQGIGDGLNVNRQEGRRTGALVDVLRSTRSGHRFDVGGHGQFNGLDRIRQVLEAGAEGRPNRTGRQTDRAGIGP